MKTGHRVGHCDGDTSGDGAAGPEAAEGAVVGVTVQGAHAGDTTTMVETLLTAAEQVDAVLRPLVVSPSSSAITATRRW